VLVQGFSNPNKTDRRFFQTRMRDLVSQGVIEKVVVRNQKRSGVATTIKCYRLVAEDTPLGADSRDSNIQATSFEDENDEDVQGIKCHITIHKQIHDLLEEAGQIGLTMTVSYND
jgi:transcription factor C subunit 3